jgi:hypothetical protein
MGALSRASLLWITLCPAFAQTTTNGFVPPVNIAGTAARLPTLKGIAVDAAGNVFFAAGGFASYSVLRLDAATGILTTAAGNGTPGFNGDGGPAADAQLDYIADLALDGAGNLYIADTNNDRVRKVSGGIITTIAGGGSAFPCDQCSAAGVDLSFLTGITTDSAGNLFIFTEGLVFKLSNGVLTKFLGYATLYPDGGVYAPGAAAVDSAGNLYVANLGLNKIQKVSNGVVSTVAGTGVSGFGGDGGQATDAQLAGPRGVAVDAAGNLYIADTGNQRIRKVSNGVITTIVGGGTAVPGLGDNGPANQAQLYYPFGVGVDSVGNVYIQDTLNHRIRKVANGVITTVAGGGSTPVLMARSAGTFATTGSMSAGRNGSTATLLDNGKVLVAGGFTSTYTASAELYDPVTGTFSATGDMTSTLGGTSATLLPDGRVLVVGTTDPNNFSVPATTQLYDPSAGAFTRGSSTLSISRPYTATLLNNGKVLITGGVGRMPGTISNANYAAELYDPNTGTFTSAGRMARAHSFPSATLLPDGRVLLAESGCASIPGNPSGNELYDSATGTFSAIAETFSCFTVGPEATILANGQVLIGGTVYDPGAGTFTPGPEVVHWGFAATLLTDGTLFMAGGEPLNCYATFFCGDISIADAYLRDPATGTFGFTGFMAFPRADAQATFLPDGTVLISGGVDLPLNDPNRTTVEIYRPLVLAPAPMLFSIPGDVNGQGAVWHTSGKVASSDNPARAGEILSTYTTSLIEGGAVSPRVIVGGRLAEVLYFGDAPGYPGYFQVNFRVPNGITSGTVPMRLRYLNRPSNEVSIAIAAN